MAPPTAPLPLAPNRAALSNRISLLLASQSSVLKTMNPSRSENPPPPPPSAPPPARRQRQTQMSAHDDDDSDMMQPARPNEGVGYVPEKTAVDSKRVDQALRGRLLGKKRRGEDRQRDVRKGKFVVESESEEDEGRTALGKRKRPRKVEHEVPEENDAVTAGDGNDDIKKESSSGDQEQVGRLETDRDGTQDGTTGDTTTNIVSPDMSAVRHLPIRNGEDDPVKKKRKKNRKKKKVPVAGEEGQ